MTGRMRTWSLALVAVLAVLNLGRFLWRERTRSANVPAPSLPSVTTSEARFARLHDVLESRRMRGRIGYFAAEPAASVLRNVRSQAAYYQAQFALSPVLLDVEADACEWAVLDLPDAPASSPRRPGWCVDQAFGGGVFLLCRDEP